MSSRLSTSQILHRLEGRMAELDLSDNAVSTLAGVDRGYLGQLRAKADIRSPTIKNLVALCEALHLRIPWVIDGTGRRLTSEPDPIVDLIEVPILSWVAASLFDEVPPIEAPEAVLYLTGLGRGDFIALTVHGDSMNLLAPDRSRIVVDRADTLLTARDFFVCATDDRHQATFKRWLPDPDRLVPYSTNPEHEPIILRKPPRVVGRVCRVINEVARSRGPMTSRPDDPLATIAAA